MKILVTILYFLMLVFGASLLAFLVMHGHEPAAEHSFPGLIIFMIAGGLCLAGWLSTD